VTSKNASKPFVASQNVLTPTKPKITGNTDLSHHFHTTNNSSIISARASPSQLLNPQKKFGPTRFSKPSDSVNRSYIASEYPTIQQETSSFFTQRNFSSQQPHVQQNAKPAKAFGQRFLMGERKINFKSWLNEHQKTSFFVKCSPREEFR
jgi:hypothetical protein